MQTTSATYKSILAGNYQTEAVIWITDTNGIEQCVTHRELTAPIEITEGCFDNMFGIGNAVAAEISVQMLVPKNWTPARMAQMRPQVRITNGVLTSEWLNKGVFFIDTRERTKNAYSEDVMNIHGYDKMLMAEQMYPGVNWSTKADYLVLQEICENIEGWSLNSETLAYIQSLTSYSVKTPYNFTYREVLQSIAAMRAGNFVMDENGELKLIPLTCAPTETYYLITPQGNYITIGGNRIVLQ